MEFCRPEVYRKLRANGKLLKLDVKRSCDTKETTRYCCNPDHIGKSIMPIVINEKQ